MSHDDPMVVGLIYRPPAGDINNFFIQFENILASITHKTILLGDYNINILEKHKNSSQFENITYGNGFAPTISLPTHLKPGCNPSSIDNILVNSIESIVKSGVIENAISHHYPIFCIHEINNGTNHLQEKKLPTYDFCESNLIKFDQSLESKIHSSQFTNDEEGYNAFNDCIIETIDECFKVEPNNFKSKRNRLLNPWITNGLINSINHKDVLYHSWKKTVTKKNKNGDESLYLKYKNYRKYLKYLINKAKKLHYSNKFKKVKGDSKTLGN